MPSLQEKISILPDTPGVYIYYNAEGTVIYVGKAKKLKRRVSSYFNREHDTLKTRLLVSNITDLNYIVVPTEQDALNLENSLIKEYKPKYNILLKDDKSYPWICVTNEYYPRIFLTYNRVKDGAKYFGPYTNTNIARTVLNLIKELYPIRSCRHNITPEYIKQNKGKLCLEYHIKNCLGCCTALISQEDYRKFINNAKMILRGDTQILLDYLRNEMENFAINLRFEEAQKIKEKYQIIERYQAKSVVVSQTVGTTDVFGVETDEKDVFINYMHIRNGVIVKSITLQYRRNMDESIAEMLSYAMSEIAESLNISYREVIVQEIPAVQLENVNFIIPQRGDRSRLLDISIKNAIQKKIDNLKHIDKKNPEKRLERILQRIKSDFRLSELPRHIECFDNSNIQGTHPVSSCVVFKNCKPSKKDYRHFNVKTVEGSNDFATMKEVLMRRYSRLLVENESLPQLIIVDGGKGQLSSAVEVLDNLGLRGKIAIVGIAKRLEEIYFPGDSIPLYIDKNSETLRIVQQLRDEAHRFGITHHRNRRSKTQTASQLDTIKGVGEKTKIALLQHFKSVKRIREASIEEIASIVGKSKASLVHSALRN